MSCRCCAETTDAILLDRLEETKSALQDCYTLLPPDRLDLLSESTRDVTDNLLRDADFSGAAPDATGDSSDDDVSPERGLADALDSEEAYGEVVAIEADGDYDYVTVKVYAAPKWARTLHAEVQLLEDNV